MADKSKIYTYAKLYTVYTAISTVIFGVGVYFVLTGSVLFEILTESGFLNITSMLIIGMHTALYVTGGSNLGSMILGILYALNISGSFAGMVMAFRKKYGFLLIPLIILIIDSVCHILVGGIMFPAVIGLGVKITGIWVLSKAYKLHKNEQKENENELT